MGAAFAKATFGPPSSNGKNHSKGALIADVQDGIVEMVDMSGNTHGLETMLLALGPQTALTTITTAQNLISQALNAGVLNKTLRTVRVTGQVIFTTASTNAPTPTLVLKLGNVTLATIVLTGSPLAVSTTNGQLSFEFILIVTATGVSGTIEAHGEVAAQLSSTLTAALSSFADAIVAASSAVNLTTAETLTLSIAADHAISSMQLRYATIEVLN